MPPTFGRERSPSGLRAYWKCDSESCGTWPGFGYRCCTTLLIIITVSYVNLIFYVGNCLIKTLETNDLYKGDKKDYSTNRGNDGVRPSEETNKVAGAETTVAPADTTK